MNKQIPFNQKYTRPFDIAAAMDGAPYCCRNGAKATVLKWEARGLLPLIGYIDGGVYGESACSWSNLGFHTTENEKSLLMTPLFYLEDKPVFVGDELEFYMMCDGSGEWVSKTVVVKDRFLENEMRWPKPKTVYETSLTDEELNDLWVCSTRQHRVYYVKLLRKTANAAIRRHEEDKLKG